MAKAISAHPVLKQITQPRTNAITFASAEDNSIEHIGNTAQPVESTEPRSDDEIVAEESENKTIESSDDATGTFEGLKTAAESAKKKFHLNDLRAHGPSKIFNPTNVSMHVRLGSDHHRDGSNDDDPSKAVEVLWRSRDNRKGRGSLAVPGPRQLGRKSTAVPVSPRGGSITMRIAFPIKDIGKNILNMFTSWPYWDMAFWSGWSYSIGSILFVIDGAWAWGPLAFPSTEWPGESKYGVPLCFFFGTWFYQVGASMAYFEAVNDGSFAGSAMKRFLDGHESDQKKLLDEKLHGFFEHFMPHRHHDKGEDEAEKQEGNVDPEAGWRTKDTRRRPRSIYPGSKRPAPRRGGVDFGETEEGETVEYTKWRW